MDVEDVVAGALELGIYELLRQRLTQEILVPSPNAGIEWLLPVPAGEAWEILSVFGVLNTSAVVASRIPTLQTFDPNGARAARIANSGSVVASTAIMTSWYAGLGATIAVSHLQAPLPTPPILLPAGWSIGSLTSNMDVGDQYTGLIVQATRWSLDAAERNTEWLAEGLR